MVSYPPSPQYFLPECWLPHCPAVPYSALSERDYTIAWDGLPPTEPKKLGKETPVGEGFVDFKRVFEELEKVGYNGPLIIEREIKGEQQTKDIKNAIQYLNAISE